MKEAPEIKRERPSLFPSINQQINSSSLSPHFLERWQKKLQATRSRNEYILKLSNLLAEDAVNLPVTLSLKLTTEIIRLLKDNHPSYLGMFLGSLSANLAKESIRFDRTLFLSIHPEVIRAIVSLQPGFKGESKDNLLLRYLSRMENQYPMLGRMTSKENMPYIADSINLIYDYLQNKVSIENSDKEQTLIDSLNAFAKIDQWEASQSFKAVSELLQSSVLLFILKNSKKDDLVDMLLYEISRRNLDKFILECSVQANDVSGTETISKKPNIRI